MFYYIAVVETQNKSSDPFLSEDEKNKYLDELTKAEFSTVPEEYRWKIDWPVNPYLTKFRLSGYFGHPNPTMPQLSLPHLGIDIQTKAGTAIVTPEEGEVIEVSINERQALLDIIFVGNSGIYYVLGHLEPEIISDIISEAGKLKIGESIKLKRYLERNKLLGRVGKFGTLLQDQTNCLTEDVKMIFGNRIDHLHVGCFNTQNNPVNPLLLFKRLA